MRSKDQARREGLVQEDEARDECDIAGKALEAFGFSSSIRCGCMARTVASVDIPNLAFNGPYDGDAVVVMLS